MGWIRGLAPAKVTAPISPDIPPIHEQTKGTIENVDKISSIATGKFSFDRQDTEKVEAIYPFQPSKVSDKDLPFINSEEVLSKRRPGALSGKATRVEDKKDYWIVIDDVVFDCTSFISDHPGGEQVILSFVGENCTWQFWRFHGENEMEQYGRELRIGRTKGIENKFKEPARFVGLSKLVNHNDW